MYIRKKKYASGNIGVIVVENINGKMKELTTVGISKSDNEVESFVLSMQKNRGSLAIPTGANLISWDAVYLDTRDFYSMEMA